MKNYLLIFMALVIFPMLNYSYAQNSSVISFDTLTVEKYGQTFKNGVILDFACQFVYPTNDTPAIKRIREQMIQSFFNVESPMPLEQAQRYFEKKAFETRKKHQKNSLITHPHFGIQHIREQKLVTIRFYHFLFNNIIMVEAHILFITVNANVTIYEQETGLHYKIYFSLLKRMTHWTMNCFA